MERTQQPPRGGRWRAACRFVVRAFMALVVTLVLLEFALRWLIFSDLPLARRLSENSLREPSLYCAHECGTEWYLVRARMAKPELAHYPCPTFDPLLGWRSAELAPETYAHVDEAGIGERRPVLFYGDSFTQCVQRARSCWQTLLEDSELEPRLALLNYGVGGFGFDQTCLLVRESLARFADRDPIVLVGLLVDDDLDRCALSLRSWPKPRFVLAGDGLALEPPLGPSAADVVAHQSPGIRSYAWRLLLHEDRCCSPERRRALLGRPKVEADTREVARRLLDELLGELRGHGLEPLFVLFHGPELTRAETLDSWREEFLQEELAARGVRSLSGRVVLRAAAAATGRSTDEFFYLEGAGRNHLSTLGNEVVFAALAEELARYSPAATSIKR